MEHSAEMEAETSGVQVANLRAALDTATATHTATQGWLERWLDRLKHLPSKHRNPSSNPHHPWKKSVTAVQVPGNPVV